MNSKITFPELIEIVAQKANTSKRVSELFLKEFFATVTDALAHGQSVKVSGLGTFKITQVSPRRSIDVNSGAEIEIPGHNKLSFTPSKDMADAINQPFAQFETVVLSDSVTADELSAIDAQPAAITPPPMPHEPKPAEVPAESLEPAVSPVGARPAAPEPSIEPTKEPTKEPAETSKPESPEPAIAPLVTPPPAPHDEPAATPPAFVQPAVEPEPQEPEEPEDYEEEYDAPDTFVDEGQPEPRRLTRQGVLVGFFAGMAVMAILAVGAYYLWVKPAEDRLEASQTPTEQVAQKTDTAALAAAAKAQPAQPDTATKPKPAAPAPAAKPAVVTDTITPNLSLTAMSRKHYGSSFFWVYIYEENCAKIKDPNRVRPGQVLVIPAAEKYGIDAHDKASVKRAKDEAFKIVSNSQRQAKSKKPAKSRKSRR